MSNRTLWEDTRHSAAVATREFLAPLAALVRGLTRARPVDAGAQRRQAARDKRAAASGTMRN